MSVPRRATMTPDCPSCTASIAARPNRVASTRSNADGVPPRWTWPRTTARASRPVRSSTSDDGVDVERVLGDEDDVGTAGHARVQRDPAGVPAHDLDDEGAVVAVAGGVQPVDRLHRDTDGGVEAERVVGGVEVVVDGLRDADDGEPRLGQLRG